MIPGDVVKFEGAGRGIPVRSDINDAVVLVRMPEASSFALVISCSHGRLSDLVEVLVGGQRLFIRDVWFSCV